MSLSFKYEARALAGRIERGAISANTRAEALAQLKRRGLTPFALKPASDTDATGRLSDAAAATGSREKAIAVGPVKSDESRSNFVPVKAIRASRFFVTLKLAPAARICRRRSVTSATVKPVW